MADDVATAAVEVGDSGSAMKTFNTVERVEVEDDDRLIDKATVVFDDVDGVAAATMREQLPVRIDIGWTNEKARVFEGIIQQVKTEAPEMITGSALDQPASGKPATKLFQL